MKKGTRILVIILFLTAILTSCFSIDRQENLTTETNTETEKKDFYYPEPTDITIL